MCRCRRLVRMTVTDDAAARSADFVERHFQAVAPTRLWVTELAYVKSYSYLVHSHSLCTGFRRVVALRESRSLCADLAIDALDVVVHKRGRTSHPSNFVHRSDRGLCQVFPSGRR